MPFAFSNLCLARPLAVLALKATGPDPHEDRVVELAVDRYAPGFNARHLRRVLDPGLPITPGATAAHGVADADGAGRLRFAAIADRLLRLLEGCDLAGYGLRRFDLPILATDLARCGRGLPMAGPSVVDALDIDRVQSPHDLASAVRRHLAREHPAAGSSTADASAVAELLDAQLAAGPGLPTSAPGLYARLVEVDVAGLFTLFDGRIAFAAGRHALRTPLEVARREPGYLLGLLGEPLLADARAILGRALARAGRGS